MSLVLAIDPGLDATGWALFKSQRGGILEQVRGLRAWGVWRTKATLGLPARLAILHRCVSDLIGECGVDQVLIERPTVAGTYRRHRSRAIAGPIEVFHLALGAIVAAAHLSLEGGREPILVPAPRLPKRSRHRRLELLLREAGRDDVSVSSPDAKDAIWIGVMYLAGQAVR